MLTLDLLVNQIVLSDMICLEVEQIEREIVPATMFFIKKLLDLGLNIAWEVIGYLGL